MKYLIGTDEAGYGPNLGPLVISATLWEVDPWSDGESLYDRLKQVIAPVAEPRNSRRIAVCDSKSLYRTGGGLRSLEHGLHPCLVQCGSAVTSWREYWRSLAPGAIGHLDRLPWYQGFDLELPIDAHLDEVLELGECLRGELSRQGVTLRSVRSVALFPDSFNRQTREMGSKGTVLSHQTIALVRQVMRPLTGDVFVQCDKHGGRNRYGPLLQGFCPDTLVQCRGESRASSIYRWEEDQRRVEIRFVAKGESFLPAALASMASKYLRELAMMAFNHFWTAQLPGVRPTAGYPVDAKRFKAEIASRQKELGIEDQVLWRCR